MIAVGAFAVLALAADFISVRWHDAREGGHAWRTAGLSAVLESLSWAPVLGAIYSTDVAWQIAAASVAGSVAGTRLAMRRTRKP